MKIHLLTWLVPFILGIFLTFLVLGGLRTTIIADPPSPQSLTPLMDKLNEYSCRKAETKKIILGGIEDGFSLAGDEVNSPGAYADYQRTRTGGKGSIGITRSYDIAGQDNSFLERFELPKNVAQGLFILRQRQASSVPNDYIAIGGLENGHTKSERSLFGFRNPSDAIGWQIDGELIFGNLDDLTLPQRYDVNKVKLPRKYETILDYIRNSDTPLDLVVSDDTMIDAVGFALCLEPDKNFGVSFLVNQFTENLITVTCNGLDGTNHCQLYSGDTLCSTELPLACFNDMSAALPEALIDDRLNLRWGWSAGEMKFTEPLKGNSFKTQDQGHEFCRMRFGPRFRMANIHEGVQATGIVALGQAGSVSQVWIDSNLEPYGNCWSLREEYPEGVSGG